MRERLKKERYGKRASKCETGEPLSEERNSHTNESLNKRMNSNVALRVEEINQ